MVRTLEGKVALITGAARGQGRSHAVRLAEEGADVIALDICGPIGTAGYSMATPADLDETVRLVTSLGRRICAQRVDVRDFEALEGAVAAGLAEFGHIDIVCANAGIVVERVGVMGWDITSDRWRDVLDVNLTGVWHTLKAAVPPMIARGLGGAIVITSSTAGLKGMGLVADYVAAKHGVVGLMRAFARELAPHRIRVNTVHPTGVRTPMVTENPGLQAVLAAGGDHQQNLLPVELVEPVDISNAILWLASDAGRYVTGASIPVDAGALAW
jgi:SDR family mycofactocin-dependent oxidoreductase